MTPARNRFLALRPLANASCNVPLWITMTFQTFTLEPFETTLDGFDVSTSSFRLVRNDWHELQTKGLHIHQLSSCRAKRSPVTAAVGLVSDAVCPFALLAVRFLRGLSVIL
jgi:hypothetical protein